MDCSWYGDGKGEERIWELERDSRSLNEFGVTGRGGWGCGGCFEKPTRGTTTGDRECGGGTIGYNGRGCGWHMKLR